MSEFLQVTEEEHAVVRLTLNRPDVHNAFDDALISNLCVALNYIATKKPRVLVLQSTGKSFSAGADLNWMKRSASYTREENFNDALALAQMLHILDNFPCTTIAAVQGAAFGGGVGLVACCDIAVASDKAIFSLSEVRLGLIPGTISPFVIKAIGARQAKRYFATAERFSADSAAKIGLVHEVTPADELPATVDKLISELLAGSPDAQVAARQLVETMSGRVIDTSTLEAAATSIADARASDSGREGVAAFLEKRKPSWVPQSTSESASQSTSHSTTSKPAGDGKS